MDVLLKACDLPKLKTTKNRPTSMTINEVEAASKYVPTKEIIGTDEFIPKFHNN